MASESRDIFSGRSSVKEFLFSKSGGKSVEKKADLTLQSTRDALRSRFPNAIWHPPFVDNALSRLSGADRFGTIFVKIDPFDGARNPKQETREGLVLDLAGILEGLCDKNDAGWGPIDADRFGCYFVGKTDHECLQTGQAIQEELSKRRKETVSIGVAQYPTLNFSRSQVFENAVKALDHAAFFGSNSRIVFDAVSLNISGDARYQEGDVEGAIREFQAARKLDPKNINVANSLGVCFAISGDHQRARECFEQARWIDPGEGMAVYNLGLLSLMAGDREAALILFLESDRIKEGVYEVVFQIGRLYLELGTPENGKRYLKNAVRIRPASAPAYRCLGECSIQMNLIDEALSAFQKAVKLNPNDAASLSLLWCLFQKVGENPEIALSFCQQSVQISPEEGLFRYRLGELYFRCDKFDEAKEELKAADRLGHDAKDLLKKIEEKLEGKAHDNGF